MLSRDLFMSKKPQLYCKLYEENDVKIYTIHLRILLTHLLKNNLYVFL